MFSQILSAFRGFFSRAFWFGNFLPVAVVAAMHMALITIVFPGTLPIWKWLNADAGNTVTGFTLLVAALVVLAYALSPMVPVARELLDGRLLPNFVHFRLRRDRVKAWHRDRRARDAAKDTYGQLDKIEKDGIEHMRKARDDGTALQAASNRAAIDEAGRAVASFRNAMLFGRLPDQAVAQAACDAAVAALRANDADYAGPDARQRGNARQLTKLQAELSLLLRRATADAHYRYDRFDSLASPLELDKYQATRVGDARWLSERYAKTAYDVPHDYLWPRLQLVMGDEDKGFPQKLSDAQSLIAFSVLALVLSATVPAAWLPILVVTQHTPWLFLGIGIATPFVLRFFYEMVVQSQYAFGRLVRGAVDQYRIDLLTKTLHQPFPATLSAERALWEKLQSLEKKDNRVELVYDHKTGASQ